MNAFHVPALLLNEVHTSYMLAAGEPRSCPGGFDRGTLTPMSNTQRASDTARVKASGSAQQLLM